MAKKARGLDVPNYWINMYYLILGKPVPSYFKLHGSSQMKIQLNTYFHRLRGQFKLPPYELKPLIYFRYIHNPLGYEDLSQYGKVYNLQKTVSPYRMWKRAHESLIEEVGIYKAINETAPNLCAVDSYLMEQALSVEETQEAWI